MQIVARKRKRVKRKRRKRSMIDESFSDTFKKEITDTMDMIVLDSMGKSDFKDFDEYQEEMESFTFNDVFTKNI